MKKHIAMLAMIFGLSGCIDHAQERAVNAAVGAAHEVSLEVCIKNAQDDIAKGIPSDTVWDTYDKCADEADKNARGK